jgi:hypothetical protein
MSRRTRIRSALSIPRSVLVVPTGLASLSPKRIAVAWKNGTIPCTNPSVTQKEPFMATMRYVSAASEIPKIGKYVLVELGSENRLSRHSRGLTVTVDRSLPSNLLEAHTETAIGEAQVIADQEDIDIVFIALPKRP